MSDVKLEMKNWTEGEETEDDEIEEEEDLVVAIDIVVEKKN